MILTYIVWCKSILVSLNSSKMIAWRIIIRHCSQTTPRYSIDSQRIISLYGMCSFAPSLSFFLSLSFYRLFSIIFHSLFHFGCSSFVSHSHYWKRNCCCSCSWGLSCRNFRVRCLSHSLAATLPYLCEILMCVSSRSRSEMLGKWN